MSAKYEQKGVQVCCPGARNGIAPHFNVMILALIFSLFREGLSAENSEVMSEFLDYYLCDGEIWKITTLLLSSTLVPMPDS